MKRIDKEESFEEMLGILMYEVEHGNKKIEFCSEPCDFEMFENDFKEFEEILSENLKGYEWHMNVTKSPKNICWEIHIDSAKPIDKDISANKKITDLNECPVCGGKTKDYFGMNFCDNTAEEIINALNDNGESDDALCSRCSGRGFRFYSDKGDVECPRCSGTGKEPEITINKDKLHLNIKG